MIDARPWVGIFSVADHEVQVVWRGLPAGLLRLAITSADRPRPVTAPMTVEVDGGPGSATISDLPAGTPLRLTATLPGPGNAVEVIETRTLDALDGPELCRVATISDLHLGTEVFGQQGTIREHPTPSVAHPERCARAALDEASAWGAERIVVKGDMTNYGQVPEWRTYRRLLDATSPPVDGLPGNHDRAFTAGRPGLSPEQAARTFGLSMASPVTIRDHDGLRIILVDTTGDTRHIGHVVGRTEAVFEAAAEVSGDRAVLVALHHHLQPHVVSEGWPIGVPRQESRSFLEGLHGANPRTLVTSGHTHRHRRWEHAGITATQVGATKDYPGVWAGYVAHEGGLRQVVRRVARPDCLRWTDHTRRAALGTWRWAAPGRLSWRCFDLRWAER